MHVCFVCNEYPRPGRQHGGIGRKIQVIARRFAAEGHRICVVGLYPRSDQWDDRGVTVSELQHAAGFRGARFVRNRAVVRRKLLELAAEQELDLVEFQDGNSPLIPLNLGVPVVVRFSLSHSYFAHVLGRRPRFLQARIERFFLPRAEGFASCSRYVAEITAEVFGLDLESIRILPNPIDLSQWQPGDPAEVDQRLILFLGSIHWVKGADKLAQAFVMVQEEFPDSRLVFLGRDKSIPDRPGTSYSRYIAERLPQSARAAVEFTGHQSATTVRSWLRRASVVALPSLAEGHSNAITEAQATAKAIVLSRRGSAAEVIEDGVSGLLCDPLSPQDIAEKICRVLREPGFRDSLGLEARRTAEDRFSIDVLYPENLDFYESTVDRSKHRRARYHSVSIG